MPMITFGVPIYNAAPYLRKCVESLLAQTVEDVEIVLVDDGSTDGSGRLAEDFARGDGRVRVLHQENGGLARARNAALALAGGEYIWFVDADDFLEREAAGRMLPLARPDGVAVCGMACDFEADGRSVVLGWPEDALFQGEAVAQAVYQMDGQGAAFNSSCNKLYPVALLKALNLRFVPAVMGEDLVFNCELLKRARSVALCAGALYHYVQRERTMVRTYDAGLYPAARRLNAARLSLYRHWNLTAPEHLRRYANAYLEQLTPCCVNLYRARPPLPRRARRALFQTLMSDPETIKWLSLSRGGSLAARLLRCALSTRNADAADGLFRAAMHLRNGLHALYAPLRDKAMRRRT